MSQRRAWVNGKYQWIEEPATRQPEPADLSSLSKFDLSPSWKDQSNRRWEKVQKAKAA